MIYDALEIFDSSLWTQDISKAKEIQATLKSGIQIVPLDKKPLFIAGVDAAFFQDKVIAVATFYSYPKISHIEDTFVVEKVTFPYIPGFLSFREGHAIVAAVYKSTVKPDVILFDGQGIAHPKGIGIASHIGVIFNIPSIGCAKSRLIGNYKEPDLIKGSYQDLIYKGERVGVVLRTRTKVKPVFVSPGHMIDIESSVKIIMDCVSNFRIPEPLRRADSLSKKIKLKIGFSSKKSFVK